LKRQRDSLKQFQHYLPTLQLKKQQLQMKILEARRALQDKEAFLSEQRQAITRWVGLLADPMLQSLDFKAWLIPDPEDVIIEALNIAGADVPVFQDIRFKAADYDLYLTPFWVDQGLAAMRRFVRDLVEAAVIRQQIKILQRELRVTTQRVNLFEKVKIPECLENIRVIRIYLGDQQANAVGISKVAKKKIEIMAQVEAVA
ncbi:MAG TPA: V-type ATP synthase subunit D, partial [Candidatus Omnitrophota bacterium]|nr:V-type ATP synthase subunit D [Candidatus Omnitrophota bacterium]